MDDPLKTPAWKTVAADACRRAGKSVYRGAIHGRGRLRLLRLLLPGLVLGWLVFGFLVLPWAVRFFGEKEVAKATGRKTVIERVAFNPITWVFRLEGFKLFEEDGTEVFVALDGLRLDVDPSALFGRTMKVRELELRRPFVHVARLEEGGFNFASLARTGNATDAPKAAPEPQGPAKTPLLFFMVENAKVLDGEIHYEDKAAKVRHEIKNLSFGLPDFTNLPKRHADPSKPAMAAKIDDSTLSVSGAMTLFADKPGASAEVKLEDFNLSRWWHLLPPEARLDAGVREVTIKAKANLPVGNQTLPDVQARLEVGGMRLSDKRGVETLGFDRLVIAEPVFNATAKTAVVPSIVLERPRVVVKRDKSGAVNLAQALKPAEKADDKAKRPEVAPKKPTVETKTAPNSNATAEAGPAGPAAGNATKPQGLKETLAGLPIAFALHAFEIKNATISVEDEAGLDITLNPINLSVRDLSTREPEKGRIDLEVFGDKGERLVVNATMKDAPLSAFVAVRLDDWLVERFSPLAKASGVGVKGGKLGLDLRAGLALDASDPELTLKSLTLENLHALDLAGGGELAAIARLAVTEVHVKPKAQSSTVGQVAIKGLKARAVRDKDGAILLPGGKKTKAAPKAEASQGADSAQQAKTAPAAQESSAPAPAAQTAQAPQASVDSPPASAPGSTPGAAPGPKKSGGGGFKVKLNKFLLDEAEFRFEDNVPTKPATTTISGLKVETGPLSSDLAGTIPFDVKAKINGKGSLAVKGDVALKPVKTNLDLALDGFDVADFVGYLPPDLPVTLKGLVVGIKGKAEASVPESGDPNFTWNGAVSLDGLDVDAAGANLASIRSLKVDGIKLTGLPVKGNVDRVTINGLTANLVADKDGVLNVVKLGQPPRGAAPAPAPKPAAPAKTSAKGGKAPAQSDALPVTIDQVLVQNSGIDYRDQSVQPAFVARIDQLGVTVRNIAPGKNLTLDLSARVNREARLNVKAQTLFMAKDLALDFKSEALGVNLPNLNPYLLKFAGRGMEAGRSFTTLEYSVKAGKLKGRNTLRIEGIKLGAKSEDPKAPTLPLDLALVFLTDTKGNIELDVPVEGEINDPKFSIGSVVMGALTNVITKAATAPFKLLALPFAGSGDVGVLEFTAGSLEFPESTAKYVKELGELAAKREKVRIELVGYADQATEREGAARFLIEQGIAALEKSEADRGKTRKNETPEKRRERLLEDYYSDVRGRFDMPRFGGSAQEKEKRLLDGIKPSDEEWRMFAQARAQATADRMIREHKAPADKIFVAAADDWAKKAEGKTAARVEVKIQF